LLYHGIGLKVLRAVTVRNRAITKQNWWYHGKLPHITRGTIVYSLSVVYLVVWIIQSRVKQVWCRSAPKLWESNLPQCGVEEELQGLT
jgi:hypothetical protein